MASASGGTTWEVSVNRCHVESCSDLQAEGRRWERRPTSQLRASPQNTAAHGQSRKILSHYALVLCPFHSITPFVSLHITPDGGSTRFLERGRENKFNCWPSQSAVSLLISKSPATSFKLLSFDFIQRTSQSHSSPSTAIYKRVCQSNWLWYHQPLCDFSFPLNNARLCPQRLEYILVFLCWRFNCCFHEK